MYGIQKVEIQIWRMLQGEEHQSLIFLSNIVRVLKLQRRCEQDA